jgi:mycothiol system anti-sigma-R factor
MKCEEAEELITAFVDNELAQADRSTLETHLATCARCRRILGQEQALKAAVRAAGLSIGVPVSLRERVLSDANAFPQGPNWLKRWTERSWLQTGWRGPVFALGLVLLLAIPIFYFLNQSSESISLAAIETYERLLQGDLPMIRAKSAGEMKEALARAVGGSFSPMGYDLSMMNLEPAAGTVHEINGRKIVVTVYRGQGSSLICYTLLGTDQDAPANAAVFFDPEKKMNFYAFSYGGVNAVLHREGNTICILASKMLMQDLLALARSKARAV